MESGCKRDANGPTEPSASTRNLNHLAVSRGEVIRDTVHGEIPVSTLALYPDARPAYFTFPTGNQNRYEHCIGVSYLAGRVVETLRKRQPELDLTEQDCLCVAIAGLCHDLGHGPFSHTFERFMKEVKPDAHWEHEHLSVDIMKDIIKSNDLMPHFEAYGMAQIDVTFVEELIFGVPGGLGRTDKKKWFLFEIIANKRNGIDVDRIDYIYRDLYNVPVIPCPLGHFDPLLNSVRAICVKDEWQLCYAADAAETVWNLFSIRRELHRRLYQNLPNGLIERMFVDMLVAANDHLRFTGPGGDKDTFRMSDSVNSLPYFLMMTDDVVGRIRCSVDPMLQTARDIHRDLTEHPYKFIGRIDRVPELLGFKLKDLQIELARRAGSDLRREIAVNDVVIVHKTFDLGLGDKNPMDHVFFYGRGEFSKPEKIPLTNLPITPPPCVKEEAFVVYCKQRDPAVIDAIGFALQQWASAKRFTLITDPNDCALPLDALNNGHVDPGTIAPDTDVSAIKEKLWELYPQKEPVDTSIKTDGDVLKALDDFEAAKAKAKAKSPGATPSPKKLEKNTALPSSPATSKG